MWKVVPFPGMLVSVFLRFTVQGANTGYCLIVPTYLKEELDEPTDLSITQNIKSKKKAFEREKLNAWQNDSGLVVW